MKLRIYSFWIVNSSWNFCETCKSLLLEQLLPSFPNRKCSVPKSSCSCGSQRYSVPSDDQVPVLLFDMTEDEVRILRPFDIHCGESRRQYRYKQRTGAFRVSWSKQRVEEKIHSIADLHEQGRYLCTIAHQCVKPSSRAPPPEKVLKWPS